jgi:hypothetical protein
MGAVFIGRPPLCGAALSPSAALRSGGSRFDRFSTDPGRQAANRSRKRPLLGIKPPNN